MRQRLDDADIFGLRVFKRLRLKSMIKTLGADLTGLAWDSPPLIQFDTGGVARNVTFAQQTAADDGTTITIMNISAGAFAVTLKDYLGATIGSVAQGKGGVVRVVGSTIYYTAFA